MKFIKYTVLFAIIGFVVGLFFAISIVGFKCSDVDSRECKSGCSFYFDCLNPLNCLQGCIDGCGGCIEGCFDDFGCVKGCIKGLKGTDGCIEFELGCEHCTKYFDLCREVGEKDIKVAHNEIINNSKAKNYVIYLTIIGTVIGFVFGLVSTIQDKRKKYQELEHNRKKIMEEIQNEFKEALKEADKNRKVQNQVAEDKWKELQDILNK